MRPRPWPISNRRGRWAIDKGFARFGIQAGIHGFLTGFSLWFPTWFQSKRRSAPEITLAETDLVRSGSHFWFATTKIRQKKQGANRKMAQKQIVAVTCKHQVRTWCAVVRTLRRSIFFSSMMQ